VRAPLGRIYLLTADHCFTDKTAISDFEFWLLIFNYQTACGSNDAPPLKYIVQVGAACCGSCGGAAVLARGLPA
jgi:hypothetical protein